MTIGGPDDGPEDRRARRIAGYAAIGTVVFIVVFDAFRTDFSVDWLVLTPMLAFAAAAFGFKVPGLRR